MYRTLVIALLSSAMALTALTVVSPADAGALVLPPAKSCGLACPGNLVNWSGGAANSTQTNPTVYLIFWGPNWGACGGADPVMQAEIDLWQGLAANANAGIQAYNNILAQYGVAPPVYGGCWVDPNAPPRRILNQADFPTEIDNALANNGAWVSGQNSQFMIFPQAGTRVSINGEEAPDFCAYHSYGVSALAGNVGSTEIFDVEPYLWGQFAGCTRIAGTGTGVARIASAMTTASTHEWAEAATDPFWDGGAHGNRVPPVGAPGLKGFSTSPAGYEIGDLCQYPGVLLQGAGYVQYLWSNADGACLGPYRLTGPWNCSKGSVDMDFNPPLTAAGGAATTVTLTRGNVFNCTIPLNFSGVAVTNGLLDNFTGTMANNSCASLLGIAPTLTGGTIDWQPNLTFEPSGSIAMVGVASTFGNRLVITYAGTIGTGSFTGSVGMQAISGPRDTLPRLAAACNGAGIASINFSDDGS